MRYRFLLLFIFAALGVRADYDTVLTTATTINATNTAYEGKSIKVDGATLTLDGTHAFTELCLTNGATLTHPAATPDTVQTIDSDDDGIPDLNVTTTGTVHSINLTVSNLFYVGANCSVDVSSKGYLPGRTLGNTTHGASTEVAGGSYGGLGGSVEGVANAIYGDDRSPAELGSGAGPVNQGGAGGGLFHVDAGSLTLDGTIVADGGNCAVNNSGGGSGGGVYVAVGTLRGGGRISAIGGNSYCVGHAAGGGGGGRVAVYYGTLAGFDVTNRISVAGGVDARYGGFAGQAGSIFLNHGVPPLTVVEVAPSGAVPGPVTNLVVRFDSSVLADTFTVDDVILSGPAGALSVTHIDALSAQAFAIYPSALLEAEGAYCLRIGTNVASSTGHTLEAVYTNRFTIDRTGPTAPVVTNFTAAPVTNMTATNAPILRGAREADSAVWINGAQRIPIGTGAWSYAVALTQGVNRVFVFAQDLAGNSSATNVYLFLVDTVPPAVTSVIPPNGACTSAAPMSIVIGFTETGSGLDEVGSAFGITRSGTAVPGSWQVTLNSLVFTPAGGLLDGAYTVTATLKDRAGWSSSPLASAFTVDTVAPAAPTVNSVSSPTTIAHQWVSGTREPDTAVLLNGVTVVPLGPAAVWSNDVALAIGSNRLVYIVRDAAGNSSPEAVVTIVFDNAAPGPVSPSVHPEGNGTSLLLDWVAYDAEANGGDIAFYTVYRSASAFTLVSQASVAGIVTNSVRTLVVTNLSRNVTHWFAVVATDRTGLSNPNVTAVAAAPCDTLPPANPSNVRFDCLESGLTIRWDAAADTDHDLAGYRIYVTNQPVGEAVSNDVVSWLKTGLEHAAAYPVRVTAIDNDGNESGGATALGYTLMDNPSNVVAVPHSGMASFTWAVPTPSPNISHFTVYRALAPFTDVTGLTPRLTVGVPSAAVAGLDNGVTNYFAVTTVNKSGGELKTVTCVSVVPCPDTNGPDVSAWLWNDAALPATFSAPGTLSVAASDPSGMSRVEFAVDGLPLASVTGSGPRYSCAWNVAAVTNDGSHVLRVTAFDTLGNSNAVETPVTVALAPPPAPTLTAPVNGALVNNRTLTVAGTVDRRANAVVVSIGAGPVAVVAADGGGSFSTTVNLPAEGTNLVRAAAVNRAGTGTACAAVSVVLDTTIPASPTSVKTVAREGGAVNLTWWAPLGVNVKGYDLYRSSSPFTATGQAVKANSALITGIGVNDLPPADGTNYYRVVAVNAAGTPSLPSEQVSAVSDGTLPRALSIVWSSSGPCVPAENRYGPGSIGLNVTLSEPLLSTPFLSVVPNGGTPIVVDLHKVSETNYTGAFTISADTPSGTAWINVSARDLVGNRGTAIDAGANALIDTAAASVRELRTTPTAPIRTASTNPVTVTAVVVFDANELPAGLPTLKWSLSASHPEPVALALTPLTTVSWSGTVALPTNAGVTPETLRFQYRGTDDLGNASTAIVGPSEFEVYQVGGLPALDPPAGLTARARPHGVVDLVWSAVQNAADYQIYRRVPGTTNYAPLALSANAVAWHDIAPAGTNFYAIATVRRANGEEVVGASCTPVSAVADSNAPPAPAAPTLLLAGNGMYLTWGSSSGDEPVTYTLYRNTNAISAATLAAGLAPILTNIPATNVVDTRPIQGQVHYAVTAVDRAGNESAPSISVYTNVGLLPLDALSVSRAPGGLPIIAWTHPNASAIAGFNCYVGPAGAEIRLNARSISNQAGSFVDSGFDNAVRRYTVRAVDRVGTNEVESPGRSVVLPALVAALTPDSTLKRGVMNRLSFAVRNTGSATVSNIVLRAAVGGVLHSSASFNLAPGASNVMPVVVGGYATLPDAIALTNTIQVTADSGETAALVSTNALAVGSDLLTVELLNETFTRGATGKARFVLHNTCREEIEIVMGRAAAAQPSDQVRFKLLNADGSVYAAVPAKQAAGERLVSLPDGTVVACLPAGTDFTSDPIELTVPTNTPDSVTLKLEVDHVHYHFGREDAITIGGLTGTRAITLIDTPYAAAVTNVTPAVSLAATNIVLYGHAWDRATSNAVARVPVRLTVVLNGFERVYNLMTDEAGAFSYNFVPGDGEAGVYRVWAAHPDLLDKPEQARFTIQRVTVAPQVVNVKVPRNYRQDVSVRVTPGAGLSLTNLRFVCRADDQPEGGLPAGLHIETNAPVALAPELQTAVLPFTLWADNSVTNTGAFVLRVTSAGALTDTWARVTVNYTFSSANPTLAWSPNYVETGVAVSNRVQETLTLRNTGLASMEDVRLALLDTNNLAAPSWLILNAATNLGALAVGDSREVGLTFAPGGSVAVGNYRFKLRVTAANLATNDINVFVAVDDSGVGGALFKILDIYSGYQGQVGLQNAQIELKKQDGSGLTTNLASDALGEAWFRDLPVGRYRYSVKADKHGSDSGLLWIRPGVNTPQEIYLEYNLVTVEWSVDPVPIEDCYNIVLHATFETAVPAAVVVSTPSSVSLPNDMRAGDVFNGEFVLRNYGLIRADNVTVSIPPSDAHFRVELMTDPPTSIAAAQTVRIPYRVTCLSVPTGEGAGGCYTWTACVTIPYTYTAACGRQGSGATKFCLSQVYGKCDSGGTPPPIPVPTPDPETIEQSGGGTDQSGGGGGSGGGPASPPDSPISGVYCPPRPPEPPPDECSKNQRLVPVNSDVNVLTGEYIAEEQDLSVKVMGGYVGITHKLKNKTWSFNPLWADLIFTYDQGGGLESIAHVGAVYPKADEIGQVFTYDSNHSIRKTETGFRWDGRSGKWMEYDPNGKLQCYGDRNNVRVWMMYDSQYNDLIGVADHFTNQVLWLARGTNRWITGASDSAVGGRTVEYRYDADGFITNIVDVLGRTTTYAYEMQYVTVYDGAAMNEWGDTNNYWSGATSNLEYALQLKDLRITEPDGRMTQVNFLGNFVVSVCRTNGYSKQFRYGYDKPRKQYYSAERLSDNTLVERRYDSNGDLIKSAQNSRVTYDTSVVGKYDDVSTYDAYRNVIKLTHPDGTAITREFNGPEHQITKEVNELGVVTRYGYDARGNLTNKLEAAALPEERETRYAFDEFGNLTATTVVNPDGPSAVTRLEYDAKGNLIAQTDPEGHRTVFTYDTQGNRTRQTDPLNRVTSSLYDGAGRLVSQTDVAGRTGSNIYDFASNQIKTFDVLGRVTAYAYDDERRLVATTNYLGLATSQEYDSEGRVIRSVDAGGRVTTYAFNPNGQLLRQASPSGVITYEYDSLGRQVKITDANGNVTATEYVDETTKVGRVVYPTFSRDYSYDLNGSMIRQTDRVNGTNRVTEYVLDRAGRTVAVTDAEGRTTSFVYDNLGRRVAEINALNATNRTDYDVFGRMIRLTDANGSVTLFSHDQSGRLIRKTYADGSFYRYNYDANGQLVQRIDAKGQLSTYRYNIFGALVTNQYYATTNMGAPEKTARYDYNDEGLMTGWSDGTTAGSQIFDPTNRVRAITTDYGAFQKTLSYRYDLNGRMIAFTPPNGEEIQYIYADNGRLARIQVPGIGAFTYEYNSFGQVAALTMPGGAKRTAWYDPTMNIASNTTTDPAGAILINRTYRRNNVNNIIGQSTEHGAYDYGYDVIDQLTSSALNGMTNNLYAYDPMGNRFSTFNQAPGTTNQELLAYVANALNQYTTVSNVYAPSLTSHPTYDLNGNLTNDGVWAYGWDAENRLTAMVPLQVGTAVPAVRLEFQYDYMSRRVGKKVYTNNGSSWALSAESAYLWNEWNMISEVGRGVSAEPSFTNYFVWGLDLSGSLQGAGGIGGLLASSFGGASATSTVFYCYDHNGNVIDLLDAASGSVVAHYQYGPFGEVTASSGDLAQGNPFRFSTKYWDDETGLGYWGYRYYSAGLGRWLSRDPIGERGGWNLYVMLFNDAINNLDPYGFDKLTITYDFADDGWWNNVFMMPNNTKWVTTMKAAEDDLKARVGLFHPNGSKPCNCIEYIALTDHSGVPGTLRFGDGGVNANQLADINQSLDRIRRIVGERSLQREREFLNLVASYLCTQATVDFVQCESGQGPEGDELRKFLISIFPRGTDIKLYETNVQWVYGTPKQCKKKKLK